MTSPKTTAGTAPGPAYDPEAVRRKFPILGRTVYDRPLVYLDTAASAQKPQLVLDAIQYCYSQEYANVHRGVHYLSQRATEAMEGARDKVRDFLNAKDSREIVFTRNATESINLVAASWGRSFLKEGDEIVLSVMEHHSNIVPWQLLRDQVGVVLKVVPIADDGSLIMEEYEKLLSPRTRLVSLTHVSNALGTVNPVDEIVRLARRHGARVLLDGCQSAPHLPVDVQALDVDFYVFSGHKLYGPSGIGVLYARAELLEAMPPYQGGGEMINSVTFEKTTWAELPYKFEAGTPHIAGAIGLGAAVDFVNGLGLERVDAYERDLLAYATEQLSGLNDVRLVGTAPDKTAILSFTLEDIHPHDAGTILDREGVAVRTGHHCAQPVMERYGVPATIRASFGCYSTREDVDRLVAALGKVREIFR